MSKKFPYVKFEGEPQNADPAPDPDDEELAETPPDVVAQLGFDPKQESA